MRFIIFIVLDSYNYNPRQGETNPCIRADVDGFTTINEAREWCYNKALDSQYSLSDFRIFVEFEVKKEM